MDRRHILSMILVSHERVLCYNAYSLASIVTTIIDSQVWIKLGRVACVNTSPWWWQCCFHCADDCCDNGGGCCLCVIFFHIPIYINLVFAMTDSICQCQTFLFFHFFVNPQTRMQHSNGRDTYILIWECHLGLFNDNSSSIATVCWLWSVIKVSFYKAALVSKSECFQESITKFSFTAGECVLKCSS